MSFEAQWLCDLITAIKRNTHGVPAQTILAMHTALHSDYLPPFWKIKIVESRQPGA
jgi:hypothetical protein